MWKTPLDSTEPLRLVLSAGSASAGLGSNPGSSTCSLLGWVPLGKNLSFMRVITCLASQGHRLVPWRGRSTQMAMVIVIPGENKQQNSGNLQSLETDMGDSCSTGPCQPHHRLWGNYMIDYLFTSSMSGSMQGPSCLLLAFSQWAVAS